MRSRVISASFFYNFQHEHASSQNRASALVFGIMDNSSKASSYAYIKPKILQLSPSSVIACAEFKPPIYHLNGFSAATTPPISDKIGLKHACNMGKPKAKHFMNEDGHGWTIHIIPSLSSLPIFPKGPLLSVKSAEPTYCYFPTL